jgi:cobalt-zinc-cadmium efflux system outer membrane protein
MTSSSRAPHLARLCATAIAIALTLPPHALAGERVTYADALWRAATFDPTADASAARVDAAEAGLRQAGVRPNPTVGVDLENFAGVGGNIGAFDRTEATFYYEQTWERGDKRSSRQDIARVQLELVRLRGVIRSLDLLEQVQAAWVEAQAAEAAVTVAQSRLKIAESLERDVMRRVQAARDPLFAGERARTEVAKARIALDQARDAARAARAHLAAFWGGATDIELDSAAFLVFTLASPPPLGDDLPELRLLAAERDFAGARIALERSRAVADPRLRAGARYLADGEGVALVVGGSIPLQRYDTNQGAIDQAQAERVAAERDFSAFRIERDRDIARLVTRRAAAIREIERIDKEVLPSADRAVRLVRDGFNRGGGAFTLIEVMQAEQAVTDAEVRRIELLKAFHLDGARLDRLLAVHLPLIATRESR